MTRLTSPRFSRSALPVLGASKLRAAQLTPSASFDGAEAFPPERWRDLQKYAPNVLIGPLSALQRLVERMDLRTIQLKSVDHAIFVLTEAGDKPLTDVTRVVLWQRFGVPVYELYLDSRGVLLASECEAQEGWHVEPGARFLVEDTELFLQSADGDRRVFTGLQRSLSNTPCACGRAGMRIIDTEAEAYVQTDVESTEDLRSLVAAIA